MPMKIKNIYNIIIMIINISQAKVPLCLGDLSKWCREYLWTSHSHWIDGQKSVLCIT